MNRRPGQNRNRRSQPPLYVDIDVRTERRSAAGGGDVTKRRQDAASPSAKTEAVRDTSALQYIVKRHTGGTVSGWVVVRHTDGSIAVDRLGRYGDDITVIDRVDGITMRYPDSGREHPAAFVARVLGIDTRVVATSLKRAGWERLDYDGGWSNAPDGEPWILEGSDHEAADAAFRRIGGASTSGRDNAPDYSPSGETVTKRGIPLNSPPNTFDSEVARSRSQYAGLKATYRTRTGEEHRRFGEEIMAREDSQRIVGRAGKSDRRGTARTVSGTREQPSGSRSDANGGDDIPSSPTQRRDPVDLEREAFTVATGWVVVLRTSGQVIVDRRTSSGNDVTVVDAVRGTTETHRYPGSGSRTGFICTILGLPFDPTHPLDNPVNQGLSGAGWTWHSETDTWTNSRSDTAWTLSRIQLDEMQVQSYSAEQDGGVGAEELSSLKIDIAIRNALAGLERVSFFNAGSTDLHEFGRMLANEPNQHTVELISDLANQRSQEASEYLLSSDTESEIGVWNYEIANYEYHRSQFYLTLVAVFRGTIPPSTAAPARQTLDIAYQRLSSFLRDRNQNPFHASDASTTLNTLHYREASSRRNIETDSPPEIDIVMATIGELRRLITLSEPLDAEFEDPNDPNVQRRVEAVNFRIVTMMLVLLSTAIVNRHGELRRSLIRVFPVSLRSHEHLDAFRELVIRRNPVDYENYRRRTNQRLARIALTAALSLALAKVAIASSLIKTVSVSGALIGGTVAWTGTALGGGSREQRIQAAVIGAILGSFNFVPAQNMPGLMSYLSQIGIEAVTGALSSLFGQVFSGAGSIDFDHIGASALLSGIASATNFSSLFRHLADNRIIILNELGKFTELTSNVIASRILFLMSESRE